PTRTLAWSKYCTAAVCCRVEKCYPSAKAEEGSSPYETSQPKEISASGRRRCHAASRLADSVGARGPAQDEHSSDHAGDSIWPTAESPSSAIIKPAHHQRNSLRH